MVGIGGSIMTAVIGTPGEVGYAEELVVEGGGAAGIAVGGLVMVADDCAVRDAAGQTRGQRIFEPVEGVGGIEPFTVVVARPAVVGVAIVYDVAQLSRINDVAYCPVADDPIGLGSKHGRRTAMHVGRIILGIRHDGDHEICSEVWRWPAEECHRETSGPGFGNVNLESRRGADVDG